MRFTAAELTEIRHAFRQRLAAQRVPKKPGRRKRKPEPLPALVREPDYGDAEILSPAQIAELFAVTPRTVRRWADAGALPVSARSAGNAGSGGEKFGAWWSRKGFEPAVAGPAHH